MTGLPPPTQKQAYCIVSALESGHLDLPLQVFLDNAVPGSVITSPSLSFLLRHSQNGKKFVFDLGIRKDIENFPPSVQTWNDAFFHATVPQDVSDSLAKGGLSPTDIDTVCISHCHWDHTGNTGPFTKAEFVVGAASATLFKPGYPEDPESGFASDLLPEGRTRFIEFGQQSTRLGPFPEAIDFYGDGSLYIVNAAGHLPGHVIVIARTAPDAWILLGGDSAHHWNLITGESQIAEGRPGFSSGCAHLDKKSAELNIQRIREFWELPRTRVIIAHDEPWYKKNKGTTAFWPGHIKSK
jgi:glyoxylase-like metal-dependent hydrolase (beta-lactamase superfamily II)